MLVNGFLDVLTACELMELSCFPGGRCFIGSHPNKAVDTPKSVRKK